MRSNAARAATTRIRCHPVTIAADVRHWLGVPEHTTSWRDRFVATVIAVLGIAAVIAVGQWSKSMPLSAPFWLIGSIGASAVLVFGVPHGPLSQPWAVLGGHGVSALVGISVALIIGRGVFPAALAVGLAIGAMHTLRCIHPPGGATALGAVVTVSKATSSWLYPLTPVLLNGTTLVVAAIILNAPFAWRRYPLALAFPRPHRGDPPAPKPPFTAEQLEVALSEIDIVASMSDEDLQTIYRSIIRQQREAEQSFRPQPGV